MESIHPIDSDNSSTVTEKFLIKEKICALRDVVLKLAEKTDDLDLSEIPVKTLADWAASLDNDDSEFRQERFNVKELQLKPQLFPKPCPSDENLRVLSVDSSLPILDLACSIIKEDMMEMIPKGSKNTNRMERSIYTGIRWIEDCENSSANGEPDLIPLHDACISVLIYRPFQHIVGMCTRKPQKPRFSQEIRICGQQTLSELRATIMCAADMGVARDMSHCPKAPIEARAWDVYKSGYFFINDTFYNDTTYDSNIDYSAPERAWASERNIGPLLTAKMEETKLEDLRVRLGYPYLYKHQGNCEHLVVFSDIFLLTQSDPLMLAVYPYVHTGAVQHSKYCMICGRFMAKWLVRNSSRVPINPCYQCDECFHSFNYKDGEKIGEFQAFPYIDETSLV